MLPKPETCRTCPLYGDGVGFVPDRLVEGAEVLILAQNPGHDEEAGRRLLECYGKDRVYEHTTPQPLLGITGYTLEQVYLARAGLARDQVSYANVLKCRYQHTDTLPSGATLTQAVEHCTAAHLRIPDATRVIVAHGQLAWDYATQSHDKAITDWRGYTVPDPRQVGRTVYATLHTASTFRTPWLRPAALADWKKLPRVLNGTWPEQVPSMTQIPVEAPPTTEVVRELLKGVAQVAIDTEYTGDMRIPGQQTLTVIGVGGRNKDSGAWQGFQVDCRLLTREQVGEFVRTVLRPLVQASMPTIYHNAAADVPVLHAYGGADFDEHARLEDLMLLHFALYSEQPHSLEYVASMAGVLPKLKHLAKTDLLRYNLGDVIETAACFAYFEREALMDLKTYAIYRDELIPLIPIHVGATQCGIRVDGDQVGRALRKRVETMVAATHMATAYAGYPIKLGSVGESGQLANYLYVRQGIEVQRNRSTRKPSVNAEAIAALRQRFLPFQEGEGAFDVEHALQRCAQGAHPLLEARALYAEAVQEISHYLAPLVRGYDAEDHA